MLLRFSGGAGRYGSDCKFVDERHPTAYSSVFASLWTRWLFGRAVASYSPVQFSVLTVCTPQSSP